MSKTLEVRLHNFAEKYQFDIQYKCWSLIQEGQRHEIEDSLFSLFNGYGQTGYVETGTEPSEYLPDIISTILHLLGAIDWQLKAINSSDEWVTVQVDLVHSSGELYQFIVEEVDASDWISPDIFFKMQDFSKARLDKTLMIFFSDDPYRMLALPHKAAIELGAIIDECSEPY